MNKSLFTLSLLCCVPAFGMQRRVTAAALRAATARAATPVARAAKAAPAAAAVHAHWAAHARFMATQRDEQSKPTKEPVLANLQGRMEQLDVDRYDQYVNAAILATGGALAASMPWMSAEHFLEVMGAFLGANAILYGVRSHRDAAQAKAELQNEIDKLDVLD